MAAGYTQITYNGITIRYCHTRRFEQEIVPTEDGSDVLMHRFMVRVGGLVTGVSETSHFQGSTFTGEPAGSLSTMRRALSASRGAFEMRMGVSANGDGTVILRADPYSSSKQITDTDYDVNNGPRVRHIEITQVAANHVFRVEIEFEICIRECSQTISGSPGVLSNKWTVTDDIDENLWTTRVYQGVLRTVSGEIDANSFRALVVPLLQPGLKRDHMNFEVSRDGLSLGYTIVDKEVNYQAPAPATNWYFKHTEETQTGAIMQSRISVMMEGPRTAARRDLIMLCVAFASIKLQQGRDNKIKSLFNFLSLSEESGSSSLNRVYLDLHATQTVDLKGIKNLPKGAEAVVTFGGLKERFGGVPDAAAFNNLAPNYKADIGPDTVLQGPISRFGAFLSYLQCPCCEKRGIGSQSGTVLAQDPESSGTTVPVTISSVETVSESTIPEFISESHLEALYTFWQCDSTYEIIEGLVAMPVAGSVVVGTSQQQTESRDSIRMISLHPPICTRIVRLAGERVGKRPEVSAASKTDTSNGITHHLTKRIIKPATSTRTADGQELFRVDAEYHFALSRAPDSGAEMEVGLNPWDTLGIQKATLGDVAGSAGTDLDSDQA